jgi:hypothetical protein
MTVDDLEKEIRKLSDADRVLLAQRLGFTAPTVLQRAVVKIDAGSEKPLALVEYADGSKQKIDILTAIRKNIMAIANPIILIAIQHWYEIRRYRSALTFGHAWEGNEVVNEIMGWAYSEHPDRALHNLNGISKAIIDAANEIAVSRDVALVARIQSEGYDQENTLLYKAFEFLRKDRTRDDKQKLKKLEGALCQVQVSNHRIPIEWVIEFLNNPNGAPYIYPKRKRWEAMRNAFIAWRFNIDRGTVKKYSSTARTSDEEIDTRFLYPRNNRYDLSSTGAVLLRQALDIPNEAYLKDDE